MTANQCFNQNVLKITMPKLLSRSAWVVAYSLFLFILVEFVVRLFFGFIVGSDAFFYGFVANQAELDISRHENIVHGRYSRYFPGQVKDDTDVSGNRFQVEMNNNGFRKPNYSTGKEPGTIRVVTLGASSTFGYHSRDHETYPAVLNTLLIEHCPHAKIEVINLGIPHLDAEQITNLFIDEGARLSPDIVTFYEGVNDSQGGNWRAPKNLSLGQQIRIFLRDKILTVKLIRQLTRQKKMFTTAQVEENKTTTLAKFLRHLNILREAVRDSGAQFVVATQLAKSDLYSDTEIAGISYASEVSEIYAQLDEQGAIPNGKRIILVHHHLMNALKAWALNNRIVTIDVVEELGTHRQELISWVHLSPTGNKLVANEFAASLAPLICSGE